MFITSEPVTSTLVPTFSPVDVVKTKWLTAAIDGNAYPLKPNVEILNKSFSS